MKKILLQTFKIILCGLLSLSATQAQRKIGTWKTYMAYQNAEKVAETPNKVFCIYDGSLISYTPDGKEVKFFSKNDGMSDVGVTQLAYNPEAKALLITYANSNIDIYSESGFSNIPSLKDNALIQDKTINNVEMIGSNAYLSTAFGIVVVDLSRKEVKETYRLNTNTFSACVFGGFTYAATAQGVRRADNKTNLMDENNWLNYPLNYGGDPTRIVKILFFKNLFTFYQKDNGVYYQNAQGEIKNLEGGSFRKVDQISNQLVLLGLSSINFYQDFSTHNSISISANDISAFNNASIYWLAGGKEGLMSIKKQAQSSDFTIDVAGIKINSPKRNLTSYITYTQNKLLVVGGGWNQNRFNNPGTLMVYENNGWFNFNEDSISKQTGLECMDFTSVAVDPRNANHYFVSSWGEGLYEFRNNAFVKLYNTQNSTLRSAVLGDDLHYIRVDGLAYDANNNLYMTNAEVYNAINVFKADSQWVGCHYSDLSGQYVSAQHLLIGKNNLKWVNIPRSGKGVFVFDDKSTPENVQDNDSAFSSTFYDQQNYNVDATGYFCLAEDMNGTVWVGTDNGPILLNSMNDVKKKTCTRVIGGSDGNFFRLLDGQKVTAIAVDGGNRKWIGTEGSGIFFVNDQENTLQVENYTSENSPLISDNINSIAINQTTGEIFIATDKGLISYMGDASEGKPDYSQVKAYPNPVLPSRDDQVLIKGLIERSTVKITDINGNLIHQGLSAGGQFTWNLTQRNGQKVKSGIYLVFASNPDGSEGVVTKIMVIK